MTGRPRRMLSLSAAFTTGVLVGVLSLAAIAALLTPTKHLLDYLVGKLIDISLLVPILGVSTYLYALATLSVLLVLILLRRPSLTQSPGCRLRLLAEVVFSPKACIEIFDPTLGDFEDEYFNALAAKSGKTKLFFIRFRGYWSFWAACAGQLSTPLVKLFSKLVKG